MMLEIRSVSIGQSSARGLVLLTCKFIRTGLPIKPQPGPKAALNVRHCMQPQPPRRLELAACSRIAYICHISFLDNYTNARTCSYRLPMADQPLPMGGNMFDRNVRSNKLDAGGAIMPLPLNLIALIISYVGT